MSDHNVTPRDAEDDAPRQVHLSVARIDAWSVMKVSFLLSVALGIAMVIATIVLWLLLDGMHVFSTIQNFIESLGAARFETMLGYIKLPRVVAYSTIAAVANVIIMTAISTVGALLYNIVASLVGGVRLSLMDE